MSMRETHAPQDHLVVAVDPSTRHMTRGGRSDRGVPLSTVFAKLHGEEHENKHHVDGGMEDARAVNIVFRLSRKHPSPNRQHHEKHVRDTTHSERSQPVPSKAEQEDDHAHSDVHALNTIVYEPCLSP